MREDWAVIAESIGAATGTPRRIERASPIGGGCINRGFRVQSDHGELFGGFLRAFYAAYIGAWPLDPGYRTRRDLYNLYHVLNHLNLFGGGYLAQAIGLIERLVAEVA